MQMSGKYTGAQGNPDSPNSMRTLGKVPWLWAYPTKAGLPVFAAACGFSLTLLEATTPGAYLLNMFPAV